MSSSATFIGHDITQAARISEFTFNLKSGIIPPRIAPHFSFDLGYPVFNFYSPFAYWIASLIHMAGISIPKAIELSFFIALAIGTYGMYLFANKYMDRLSALVASVAYLSSPFIAVDIFVRYNLAEIWFFALFPLSLYLLITLNKKRFFITTLILSALFTSHNVFSLIAVLIMLVYSLILKSKQVLFATISALLLGSYFLIPALLEMNQVNVSAIASMTKYKDHFLCISQIWSSPWGFGGSTAGCISDGMSFMVGKIQLVFGLFGIVLLLYRIYIQKNLINRATLSFIAFFVVFSIFLTINSSQIIWTIFEPILKLFQFPWRFLLLTLFGLSFFTGYTFTWFSHRSIKIIATIFTLIILIILNQKYFYGQPLDVKVYDEKYLSSSFINNSVAYKIPEYLPISANYNSWKNLELNYNYKLGFGSLVQPTNGLSTNLSEGNIFDSVVHFQSKENFVVLNKHIAPYWKITLNGSTYTPKTTDDLGRPNIMIIPNKVNKIEVIYKQTNLERLANLLSIFTCIILFIYSYSYLLWHRKATS